MKEFLETSPGVAADIDDGATGQTFSNLQWVGSGMIHAAASRPHDAVTIAAHSVYRGALDRHRFSGSKGWP